MVNAVMRYYEQVATHLHWEGKCPVLRGNARQPRRGDKRPVREDSTKAQVAHVAQLGGISVPVLRFSPRGRFLEHCLANGRLETVRSDEDITCRGGPILEAQHNRCTWLLDVTLEALG